MPLEGDYAPGTSDWARIQAELFEATAGAEGAELRGMPVIVLTSIGAMTGMLRKTALMRVEHEGEYAVVASLGGAQKHPVWWKRAVAAYPPYAEYQDKTNRQIPVFVLNRRKG